MHIEIQTSRSTNGREERPTKRPLAGVLILVVDDDARVRRVIEKVLSRSGANVIDVGSADQALAAVCALRPQLIVSDINMPLEDGYSLLRRIRALDGSWAAQLPAIALTGGGGVASALDARRAGFASYLTKPFRPDVLVRAAIGLLGLEASEH